MRLEQVTLKIENEGLGRRGVDLFIHFLPATVPVGIVLLPSLAGTPLSWELPGWQKFNLFQLLVRHSSVTLGYELTTQVGKAITNLTDQFMPAIAPDVPAINARYIRPKHDIIVMPRSPSNYFEFSQNFECAFSFAT